MRRLLLEIRNGAACSLVDVPRTGVDEFLAVLLDALGHGWRLSAYFGAPGTQGVLLLAVLADDARGLLGLLAAETERSLPSIAYYAPQAAQFEREIIEQCGLVGGQAVSGRPLRFQPPLPGVAAGEVPPVGVMPYYTVAGEEVHEVAVGPVHAGIIEPGHFRFQCHGEEVFSLEISLGYQHRGVERALLGGPHPTTLQQLETVAGDTTIGHALAYCQIMEALQGSRPSLRSESVRALALELERLANHTGDLGALAGDVGYLPTQSFCGRIRGDFLNMTADLCGSRFGRHLLRPGGVVFPLADAVRDSLLQRLAAARRDVAGAVDLLWTTPSVLGRFQNTGVVSEKSARELGLVGPAARASGLLRDVRQQHPFGLYRSRPLVAATGSGGDVHARARVRWQEISASLDYVEQLLQTLPAAVDDQPPVRELPAHHLAVALTEGWRGEVCHVALTDGSGRFARYKVVDPSFHNWQGLAMALRNEQISDFPLCNKSFNLSYCGFDL